MPLQVSDRAIAVKRKYVLSLDIREATTAHAHDVAPRAIATIRSYASTPGIGREWSGV